MLRKQLILSLVFIGLTFSLFYVALKKPYVPANTVPVLKSEPIDVAMLPKSLPLISGKSWQKKDDSRYILINFWATWCLPCLKEIPELIELHQEYQTHKIEVLGVSMDREKELVARFLPKMKMDYPVLFYKEVHRVFGAISAIPTTMVFDASYQLIYLSQGLENKENLLRGIREAQKKETVK